jgi:hypothetical protein
MYNAILGNNEKKVDLFEFSIPARLHFESELVRTKLRLWLNNKEAIFNNYKLKINTDLEGSSSFIVDSISISYEVITLPSVIL